MILHSDLALCIGQNDVYLAIILLCISIARMLCKSYASSRNTYQIEPVKSGVCASRRLVSAPSYAPYRRFVSLHADRMVRWLAPPLLRASSIDSPVSPIGTIHPYQPGSCACLLPRVRPMISEPRLSHASYECCVKIREQALPRIRSVYGRRNFAHT